MARSIVSADALLGRLRTFADTEVADYLSSHREEAYPEDLVRQLREWGVFGANIPPAYGGLGWEPAQVARLTYELARGWQSLAGLASTHLKLCRDVLRHGTDDQKDRWLPAMASGERIFARAYHEAGVAGLEELGARIELQHDVGVLNGRKSWVTNAHNADRILAIARGVDAMHAVIVDPGRPQVRVGDELPRPGMLGVSLAEVEFAGYEFDPDRDLLGGRAYDVTTSVRAHDMTSYVARALASADVALEHASREVRKSIVRRPPEARGAIRMRLGELRTRVSTMRAVWRDLCEGSIPASAEEAKVFCSLTAGEVIGVAATLCGGGGYAGPARLSRHYRDVLALQIVGAPNDVLLSRIGERELGETGASMERGW